MDKHRRVYETKAELICSENDLEQKLKEQKITERAHRLAVNFIHAWGVINEIYSSRLSNLNTHDLPSPIALARNPEEKYERVYPFSVIREMASPKDRYYIEK